MVKKILSIIILIMIISSTFVYSAELNNSIETLPPSSNNNTIEEDKTISSESKKDDTDINSGSKENASDNKSNVTIKDNNINSNATEKYINNNKQENKETTQTKDDNKTNASNNKIQKSSEARLSTLKVDQEGLTPEFDKNTTEYYLIVDTTVNQIKVTTSTVDKKATVTILGNENLEKGQNTVTINVKAEDGTEKIYYIYVTKVDSVELANAELNNIEIEGYNLYPSFKSNIYNYNININQNITSLNINPTPQREKANIEIEGNTNLKKGENVIKIIVTAEDNTTVRIYKINAYIDSNVVEIKEENKIPALIMICVLSVCIVALGIYIVIKNKRLVGK